MRVGKKYASARVLLAAGAMVLVAAPALAAPQLTVFGDSYSIPVHDGTRDWPLLLQDAGIVGRVNDFARFGATASSGWHINFAQQLQRWDHAGRPLGRTVVYLGFNDIGVDLTRSEADFTAGINELVDAGANAHGNRLYLVLPHDVGSTPLYNRSPRRQYLRHQTEKWDAFVAYTAHHVHATVIDVFAAIDRVPRNPRASGFTNVTTADHALSGSTALYNDAFHVGERGQTIIARTIAARLGGRLAVRRLADARAGLAELDEAPAPGTDAPGGLTAFAVGDPAPDPAPEAEDPARAGFAQAYPAAPSAGGGFGVAYRLGAGTVLGGGLTRHADAARVPLAGGGAGPPPGPGRGPAPPRGRRGRLAGLGRGAGPPRAAAGAAGARQRPCLQPGPLRGRAQGRAGRLWRPHGRAGAAGGPAAQGRRRADGHTLGRPRLPRPGRGRRGVLGRDAGLGRPRRGARAGAAGQAGEPRAAGRPVLHPGPRRGRGGRRRGGTGGGRGRPSGRLPVGRPDARGEPQPGRAARGGQRRRAGARPRAGDSRRGPDPGRLAVLGRTAERGGAASPPCFCRLPPELVSWRRLRGRDEPGGAHARQHRRACPCGGRQEEGRGRALAEMASGCPDLAAPAWPPPARTPAPAARPDTPVPAASSPSRFQACGACRRRDWRAGAPTPPAP